MSSHRGSRASALWVCSRCGRRFAKPNQAHSCCVRRIGDHFRGKDPKLESLFKKLVEALERSGPLRVDAVETTIHLVSRYHFGGIAVRREYLRVGFILSREIRSNRIERYEKVGPRRIVHYVTVGSLDDLDAQLLGWLAESQAMQDR